MTVSCAAMKDAREAVAFLRQDPLRNAFLIGGLENNAPPYKRAVWTAHNEDGTVVGVVCRQHYKSGAEILLYVSDPNAIPALLRCLPTKRYVFSFEREARYALLAGLSDVKAVWQQATYVLSRGELRRFEAPGEIRSLRLSDRLAAEQFARTNYLYGSELPQFIEQAEAAPDKHFVLGIVQDGEVLAFASASWLYGAVWQVDTFTCHKDYRESLLDRAILSYACAYHLDQGHTLVRQFGDKHPAVVPALHVGFHEIRRFFACDAKVFQGLTDDEYFARLKAMMEA